MGKGNGLCKDGHEPICLRKARKLRHMSESEVSQKGRRGLIDPSLFLYAKYQPLERRPEREVTEDI